MTVMTHPITYDDDPIQIMHMMNVKIYQDFKLFLLQSGIVISSIKLIGQVQTHHIFLHVEFGQLVILTISTKNEEHIIIIQFFFVTFYY